jgi:hypothetical protein
MGQSIGYLLLFGERKLEGLLKDLGRTQGFHLLIISRCLGAWIQDFHHKSRATRATVTKSRPKRRRLASTGQAEVSTNSIFNTPG